MARDPHDIPSIVHRTLRLVFRCRATGTPVAALLGEKNGVIPSLEGEGYL